MTDYDQQDEWGQLIVDAARLARSRFDRRSACVPVLFRLWQPACSTGHRRCDRPGRSSHTQVAGFPVPTHNWNSWHSRWCLRASSHSFHSGAAHITPKPFKVRVGVTTVCSTSAPNRKICKDLIRRKSGNCSNHCHFFPPWFQQKHEGDLILGYFDPSREQLFIFRSRPRVNLECHQPVTVIYVMFSLTPDSYLNDSPTEQLTTCNNFLISQNNLNRARWLHSRSL